jgi:anti-sigma factor RsiW
MDCTYAKRLLQDAIDGRLPPRESGEFREHLSGCSACSAEDASLRRTGDLLRLWASVRTEEREPQLHAMWTRVSTGIGERKKPRMLAAARRWFWVPAVALAVFALLFYPSHGTRAPFHPKSFDVSVESLESETATVALVEKGEDLPRVIWILEDAKS